MKLRFSPLPVLTIVTVISLAILIALGTWQYQRLQWKTELLAQVEQVADAPPFSSLQEVQAALEAGEPIDFRRFGADMTTVYMGDPFFVFTPQDRDISWRMFVPALQNGTKVFAALSTVADDVRQTIIKNADQIKAMPQAGMSISGYIRLARGRVRGAAKSTPDKNRWFGFNPMPETHNWADDIQGPTDMRFYVDVVAGPGAWPASSLPPQRPNIRNNHFDYMLTWYGLAIALFVIYLIMHARAGRLSWR